MKQILTNQEGKKGVKIKLHKEQLHVGKKVQSMMAWYGSTHM